MSTGSRDWIGFAIMSLACEALRFAGVGFAPVRAGYLVDTEQMLTGSTAAAGLQSVTTSPAVAAVAATVWPVLIAVTALIWRTRRDRFAELASALLLAQYASLLLHLALPTIPPTVAGELELTVPVADLAWWQPLANRLATMPALPAALATVLAAVGLRAWRGRGLPLLAYGGLVAVAAMQSGHHYLAGVLAGAALGLVAALVARRRPFTPPPGPSAVAGVAGVAVLAVVVGLARPSWHPDRAFAERELGLTPVGLRIIGEAAYAGGDWPIAAAALEQLPARRHDADSLLMLGVALGHQEHYQVAHAALRAARRMAPDDPRPYYWANRFGYVAGTISEEQLLGAVHVLHEQFGTDEAKKLATALEDLLGAPE